MNPRESRPGETGAAVRFDGDQTSTSLLTLPQVVALVNAHTPPRPWTLARKRWAYSLIRRTASPPPAYGTPEWLALSDSDPAKVAAVVVAAEAWTGQMDTMAEDIIRELDERRRVDKELDDAAYQARAAAHRKEWKHLRVVEPYADRRARELARSAQARRQSREGES